MWKQDVRYSCRKQISVEFLPKDKIYMYKEQCPENRESFVESLQSIVRAGFI